MKSVLLISLILIFTLSALTVSAADLTKKIDKNEILKITELKEGEYQLKTGPSACADGTVELTGEPGDWSLVVGPYTVIEAIGKSKDKDQERGCEWTIETSYAKGLLTSVKTEVCKDLPRTTHRTRVTFSKNSFVVHKKIESAQKNEEHTCEYSLIETPGDSSP